MTKYFALFAVAAAAAAVIAGVVSPAEAWDYNAWLKQCNWETTYCNGF